MHVLIAFPPDFQVPWATPGLRLNFWLSYYRYENVLHSKFIYNIFHIDSLENIHGQWKIRNVVLGGTAVNN